MRTIAELQAALKSLNLKNAYNKALGAKADDYAELQKDQMQSGLNSEEGNIGSYKTFEYANMKYNMNPKAGLGNVDLKLTGAFYDGITAQQNDQGMLIDSSDSKSGMLKQKYGSEIFTLDIDNTNKFIEEIGPIAMQDIVDQLNQ